MAGGGLAGRGSGRPDKEVAAAPQAGAPEASIAMAAQVSLAAAAKASAENFPVALRLLPGRWRRHLTALYGFARLTDDLGDEPLPGLPPDTDPDTVTKTRLQLLDDLQADVARIYEGGVPQLAANRALQRTVSECGIPPEPFYDLIQANRQDQVVTRYQSYQQLVDYCTLSANPVGRVVLHIVGAATADRVAMSDSICTALQLIEHSQDVAEDLGNGRIYLPREDLDAHGVTEADLAEPTAGENVRALLRFQADRADALLSQGAPLVGTLHGAARLAIAGYVAGGRAAIKAIRRAGYDVLRGAPKPGKQDTLGYLASCYVKGR